MNAMPLSARPYNPLQHHRTVGIIQARMGSSRLPGKVLLNIAGAPMLLHVVQRARRAACLDHVLVATSTDGSDDVLAAVCARHDIPCFRGSPSDVLDRFYQAARQVRAETIVRLTADCPLHDGGVMDQVITAFECDAYDYVSNVDPPTFPDGLDTEVFTFAALERAWWEASLPSEREHVTPYLRAFINGFRTGNVVHAEDLSSWRWTVDELVDLAFTRAVYHALGTYAFGMADVVALLKSNPHLRTLNAHHTRNEGYFRSLQAA